MKNTNIKMQILDNENGFALIIVLLVVTILVALVVEFSYLVRVDISIAGNIRDQEKAFYLAKSGINVSLALLKEDERDYDDLSEDWAIPKPAVSVENGYISIDISDEDSKININSLIKDNQEIDEDKKEQLTRLFTLLEINSDILDNIIDWIDEDDQLQPNGAEDDYYQSLENPYSCKNNKLDTISELILIKDIDDKILWGTDEIPGLASFLTVNSGSKININTADAVILQSLSEKIDEALADEIENYRKDEPFTNISDLKNVPGMTTEIYSEISKYIDIKSSYFDIQANGFVNDTSQTIKTIINRTSDKIQYLYWNVS